MANPGVVWILGTQFGSIAGTVTVNGSAATVQSWVDNLIVAATPTGTPYTAAVTIVTTAGASATGWVYMAVPVLASAASDRYGSSTISGVTLNGGGNQIHVAPGSTIAVDFLYSTSCGPGTCPIAIQIGFNTGAPQACFYARKNGLGHQTLTAPTQPGTYDIVFDRNQNFCQPVWDFGTPPPAQNIGSIAVF